ncbi:MAG: nicotinamide-nucleotide amidohydrolase family protein [Actinomycetes bacterium]|nr:nicotinamide-nucleotide amidohydrolase family protein [Actinomycetes bacterium]MDX5380556.1 nicotinamide-nucleotide amidohydrolase family protein [Actinomycetes bacterium]MDX5399445.1 nicotinamide-nucleotide amidohydrolase family protein [Actinomycetes bacterium]MDX5450296.1 nicotinamide-nucleotide amidohydrolase family protein [Actinomycetes bacterium]
MTVERAEALRASERAVAALGGRSVATAESLTAGLVSATLARIPGVSAILRGGVTAYCSEVKISVLRVPEAVLDEDGPVQPAVAEAMARGACEVLGSRFAVATTGVAGPGPADGVPAGTVIVSAHDAGTGLFLTRRLALAGDRDEVRWGAVVSALGTLAVLAEQTGVAHR